MIKFFTVSLKREIDHEAFTLTLKCFVLGRDLVFLIFYNF